MIRPDAIPLLEARSRVTLPPEAARAMFGDGYRWRGSERVRVVVAGRADVALPAVAGSQLVLELDRLDADLVGPPPVRMVGPRGTAEAADWHVLSRLLVLPSGILRAWRLAVGQRVVLQAGSVIFMDVEVAEGQPAGASLDRADLIAAGIGLEATAALRRDLEVGEPPGSAGANTIRGRLITENDVRQARLRGRRLTVQPGQKVTPAAQSLGRELGVLEWPADLPHVK